MGSCAVRVENLPGQPGPVAGATHHYAAGMDAEGHCHPNGPRPKG